MGTERYLFKRLIQSMVFGQKLRMISLERAYQEEQNGANVSFIAASSEELCLSPIHMCVHGKGRHSSRSKEIKIVNTHNSSLEGATKLKFVSFCSS